MKSALLRFAPAYDSRIVTDPKFARTLMVQRGALEQINRDQPIPVVVDHDMSRQVGTVREIFVAPDVNGGVVQDWYFASVEIAEPPGWLKYNGGVSWSHSPLQTQDVNASKRLLRGLIREISILSPSTKPAEPLARVAWVGEKQTSSPASGNSDRPVAGETVDARFDDELSRLGYRGGDVEAFSTQARRSPLDRLYEEHIAAKRQHQPQVLVRHGVGQVLAVR